MLYRAKLEFAQNKVYGNCYLNNYLTKQNIIISLIVSVEITRYMIEILPIVIGNLLQEEIAQIGKKEEACGRTVNIPWLCNSNTVFLLHYVPQVAY